MAVFDVIVNHADRKGAHIAPMPGGHRYGVDHGLTFHVADKLRTVLWGWLGEALSEEEPDGVGRVLDGLDGELGRGLAELLNAEGNRSPRRTMHPVARRRDLPGTERADASRALAAVLK
ncbi:putative repeat protein (TIGR03843 family) [Micrococcus sp. KT16]|nr:putative repeat protein (TIGR03843 family) [Micrococcus sp. KT16]